MDEREELKMTIADIGARRWELDQALKCVNHLLGEDNDKVSFATLAFYDAAFIAYRRAFANAKSIVGSGGVPWRASLLTEKVLDNLGSDFQQVLSQLDEIANKTIAHIVLNYTFEEVKLDDSTTQLHHRKKYNVEILPKFKKVLQAYIKEIRSVYDEETKLYLDLE